jgi:uncharacterized protein (DUF4415 family)
MSKIVRHEVDLNKLPPLTDAQKAELKALSEMPDRKIDYSDIPPLDDAFWKNAARNPFYKPTKTSTTVRVDSNVLAQEPGQGLSDAHQRHLARSHASLDVGPGR